MAPQRPILLLTTFLALSTALPSLGIFHRAHGPPSDGVGGKYDGDAIQTLGAGPGAVVDDQNDAGSTPAPPGGVTIADPRYPHIKAEPRDGVHHGHDSRNTPGVYECANKQFVRPCTWTPVQEGVCYNRLYGALGSMGPDKGLICHVYYRPNCDSSRGWENIDGFKYPGTGDYQDYGLFVKAYINDDGPASYRCRPDT